MIIYWSMILWVFLIYLVYSMTHKEEIKLTDYNIQQGIQKKIPLVYAVLVFGYFIFWIGMRGYMADTSLYIVNFNAIPSDFSTAWSEIGWGGKGPGFDIFNVFFKCLISQDYQWWLMTIAIVCGVCLVTVFRKYSVNYFMSCFLFMTMITYTWMLNGMRQFIAVAILFLCCDWIKDGKFIKFLIAVLILSTVHFTCIMMIPIYFVARLKPWSKKIVLFIFAIILLCVFAEPFFGELDNILSDTGYSGFTEQFAEDDGVNPIRVLFYAIPPLIAFWKRNVLAAYYEKNRMLPIMINMSLITAALYLVGVFTSGILIGRLPIYCEVYNLIFMPYLLYVGFNKQERKIIMPVYVMVMLLFFYLQCLPYYVSDFTGYVL